LYIVIGAGSVGSLIGGLLTKKRKNVILVGNKPHISSIALSGLQITGLIETTIKSHVLSSITKLQQFYSQTKKSFKCIFITTKAHHTKEAIEQLSSFISKKVPVVLIQNGLGTEDIAREILPNNPIIRGVTSIGVTRPQPGEVLYQGVGDTLLGFTNDTEQKKATKIASLLSKAGLKTKVTQNIEGAVFTKTIVNCALNPLTALYSVRNNRVYNDPELRELAEQIVLEASKVAEKLNIELTHNNPLALTWEICQKTGENINSMLSDVRNHRKTEIDFINGKIVEMAQMLGIEIPVNKMIYQKVRDLEQSYLSNKNKESETPGFLAKNNRT
jgi:2-dehydropantoate 2-reductase